MKLAIVSQDGKSDFICPKDGPWLDFYEKLRSSQFFEIVSLKHNPDAIIFNNHSEKVFYSYGKNIPSSKKLLILWESSVTKPSNFVRNLLNLYGKIFSPSSLWLEGENVEKFRWPQQLLTSGDDNRFINYTERKQKVILLNSNKYSFEKGQMYVFRRRIATILEDEIDIYGEGWSNRTGSYFEFAKSFIRKVRTRTSSWSLNQRPIFVATDNVFGPVDSKSVMNQYRFSLIIENSLDYVSEKLFDAIQFGTVPIYVGPQLSEFGIPNEVAIQCEPSEVQVADKIASLRGDLTLAIDTLKAGRKFMTSFEAKEWSNSEVLISLADSIEAYLRDQLT